MKDHTSTRQVVQNAIASGGGMLLLGPTWVAREIPAPGKRLGLPEDAYERGDRGAICERWLGSTTRAISRYGPPDEGLSQIKVNGETLISLREALVAAGDLIMGSSYAKTHAGLGRLAKIFDHADRIPFHFHQMAIDAAKVGQNPKEEAYYFPKGKDLGPHPETFMGVHPNLAESENRKLILPYLQEWQDDLILQSSRAYLQIPGDGFHLPAGILHAPGTALTIELQEDSDVYSILQARVSGKLISKDFLFNGVHPDDRKKYGEAIILEQINWALSGDPYFYHNRHTPPLRITGSYPMDGYEEWIFYNTPKFSGKKLVVNPGTSYRCQENGVYNLLVWQGRGNLEGNPIEAGNFDQDEYLVTYDQAILPHTFENEGEEDLVIFKFFGPDINPDVPMLLPIPP